MKNKCKMKKGFIKKMCGIMIILTLIGFVMTGCQLAEDDGVSSRLSDDEITNADIFCGVYLSTEDLFNGEDFDLSAEDIKKLISDEEVDIDSDTEDERRIYAVKSEKTDENGASYIDYTFEGCEGAAIFQYYVMEKDGQMSYASQNCCDGASDVAIELHNTDEGRENKITATVNVNEEYVKKYKEKEDDFIIYVYSVYETSEGEVYMIPGEENYALSDCEVKISLSDSTKIKMDGEEKSYSFATEFSIKQIMPVDKTILCQMDSKNQQIDSIEIDNSNIPEKVKINKDAEYIIVERYTNGRVSNREMVETQTEDEEELTIELPVKDEKNVFINETTVELEKE